MDDDCLVHICRFFCGCGETFSDPGAYQALIAHIAGCRSGDTHGRFQVHVPAHGAMSVTGGAWVPLEGK